MDGKKEEVDGGAEEVIVPDGEEQILDPAEADDAAGTDENEDKPGDAEPAPFWLSDGEEDPDDETPTGDTVPVAAHVKTKRKLKSKLSDRDSEIEQLRAENEALKKPQQQAPLARPKRPRTTDFDDQDKYEEAMDVYEDAVMAYQTNFVAANASHTQQQVDHMRNVDKGVDAHYDRAAVLVTEQNIDPDVFRKADETVKGIIEAVLPRKGEIVFNELVSMLGEGSEKAMIYVGTNKNAKNEFHSLLNSDKTGIKAAMYLGRISERINSLGSKTSQARKPAKVLKGGTGGSAGRTASAFQKKYAEAHKAKRSQEAFNIKREAKAAGVDTSKWS